jgi:hypothetical protein
MTKHYRFTWNKSGETSSLIAKHEIKFGTSVFAIHDIRTKSEG